MNADEFWVRLGWRISGELAGVPDNSVRFWWCDGFVKYSQHREGDTVRGGVWMFDGPRPYKWQFELHLPTAFDPDVDDWSAVLPGDDVTGWLRMDKRAGLLTIEPSKTRPDRRPAPDNHPLEWTGPAEGSL